MPIEALLIDTPGANGQKKNANLLTHRARYPALEFIDHPTHQMPELTT